MAPKDDGIFRHLNRAPGPFGLVLGMFFRCALPLTFATGVFASPLPAQPPSLKIISGQSLRVGNRIDVTGTVIAVHDACRKITVTGRGPPGTFGRLSQAWGCWEDATKAPPMGSATRIAGWVRLVLPSGDGKTSLDVPVVYGMRPDSGDEADRLPRW